MKTLKFYLSLLIISLITCAVNEDTYVYSATLNLLYDKSVALVDSGKVDFDDTVTGTQLADAMGFGFNLGNTFDAFDDSKGQNQGLDAETCWGVTKTSKEIIEGLVKKGFKAIRIPVTWHNHLVDNKYTVDPEWMKRIKTVVDWSLDAGLVVILNDHHDNAAATDELQYGQGYYPSRKHITESTKFLYNLWTQIANAFNNGYNERLVFETLNEPRPRDTDCEWTYKKGDTICEEAASVVNEFNRLIVKAIRETGGNNEKRFIMVTPVAASYGAATASDFIFPGDSRYNPSNSKIMLSVHMYLPYNFAMNKDTAYVTFEEAYANELGSNFKYLYENFCLKGHQTIVGEMGTIDKNNTAARVEWAKYYMENSRKFNLPCYIWDNQWFFNPNIEGETLGLYHRNNLTWSFEEYVDAFIKLSSTPFENNPPEVFPDSLLSKPYEFKDWVGNLAIGAGTFSSFNSYSTLLFSVAGPSYSANYASVILYLGDWSNPLVFSKDEVTNGTPSTEGGISLAYGKELNVEVKFNAANLALAKERGVYMIGHGFQMTKLSVSGPKLVKMDPLTFTRSTSKEQRVKLQFSEDATIFVGKIKFLNEHHDLNEDVTCELDTKDNTRIECKGKFYYSGEYKVADANEVLLSGRSLFIVPEEGGEPDFVNFIESKVSFDSFAMLNGLRFSGEFFPKVNRYSTLVIETGELIISPSYRVLFIYRGDTSKIINVGEGNVNGVLGGDGGIALTNESTIRVSLATSYNVWKSDGVTLRGYGFSIKAVYLE